jgi:hypothetical protein
MSSPEVGFDVVALEPGDALRACAGRRAPQATFVGSTFEEFEADGHFGAVFSSNAFHWVDPEVGYSKLTDIVDSAAWARWWSRESASRFSPSSAPCSGTERFDLVDLVWTIAARTALA